MSNKFLKVTLVFCIAFAIMIFIVPNLAENYFPSYIDYELASFFVVLLAVLIFVFGFGSLLRKKKN